MRAPRRSLPRPLQDARPEPRHEREERHARGDPGSAGAVHRRQECNRDDRAAQPGRRGPGGYLGAEARPALRGGLADRRSDPRLSRSGAHRGGIASGGGSREARRGPSRMLRQSLAGAHHPLARTKLLQAESRPAVDATRSHVPWPASPRAARAGRPWSGLMRGSPGARRPRGSTLEQADLKSGSVLPKDPDAGTRQRLRVDPPRPARAGSAEVRRARPPWALRAVLAPAARR